MELGLYTFADVNPNPSRSKGAEGAERLKHLIEEIELLTRWGSMSSGLASITAPIMRLPFQPWRWPLPR